MKNLLFIFVSGILCVNVTAQNSIAVNLQNHVKYLADDKLQGRATGSAGELLAARYIVAEFMQIGLKPMGGENSYLLSFQATSGRQMGDKNFLSMNGNYYNLKYCYPHPMSANGQVNARIVFAGYGISAPDLQYNDYENNDVKNKIVLVQLSAPEADNPHSKFSDYADERMKIQTAQEKGAAAVIFFNTDSNYQSPVSDYKNKIQTENIPVYFVSSDIAEKLKKHTGEIDLSVELDEIKKTGHNIIGYIDNGAANTVVIGAHYDHLGHGEIEGSLYRGDSAIHNGADDNASGVALMIELARKLKASDLKNNNYVFLAFSGEEMGLLGSHAFVHSDLMKKFSIDYMLNFDMVGRLDSTTKTLLVNGVGTSPAWAILKTIDSAGLHIKTTESGIGPSDQTSFYLQDIPVLFFFTGTHSDYHKPTDDAEKINYAGMQHVLQYAFNIIEAADDDGKISFTKTKDEKQEAVPAFKVTLGVVPDYAFEGRGMRIDGITDGKPASKAGLHSGDVVVKLGIYEVADMMSYMKALGKFSKGEQTTVTVLRNSSELSFPVTF